MMTLPNMQIKALTVHPHTETHPRLSPDGKKVAFIRSHKQWQSWRNQKPWDLWIKEIESGKETLLTRFATAPTWSENGESIFFYRHIGEIWEYDLVSSEERRLTTNGIENLPNTELFWPSLNDEGRIAVSYKDAGRPKNLISNGNGDIIPVAPGCMITWAPSGDFAFFVSSTSGGKQSNQFNRYNPEDGSISHWMDLPGEHSHEYFPRLDASENYLVFSASADAHEPDIENYEVFLWNTNTPESEAIRLTFDNSNDSWPDIFLNKSSLD